MKNRVANILLKIGAVTLRPGEPFKYASGMLSPIYTDCRLLLGRPVERKEIIQFFVNLLEEEDIKPDVIAGTATAGIPHAAWLAEKLDLPMVYVRQTEKDHGKKNQIEGKIGAGQRAVVVEDLISTGGSSLSTVAALRAAGAIADDVLAIFTYGFPEMRESFKKEKITVHSLTDLTTLVQEARKFGVLDGSEEATVKDWITEPWGWAKKYGLSG